MYDPDQKLAFPNPSSKPGWRGAEPTHGNSSA